MGNADLIQGFSSRKPEKVGSEKNTYLPVNSIHKIDPPKHRLLPSRSMFIPEPRLESFVTIVSLIFPLDRWIPHTSHSLYGNGSLFSIDIDSPYVSLDFFCVPIIQPCLQSSECLASPFPRRFLFGGAALASLASLASMRSSMGIGLMGLPAVLDGMFP